MNENTINERKKTDIGTGVQMSKIYNTIALLRRAMKLPRRIWPNGTRAFAKNWWYNNKKQEWR